VGTWKQSFSFRQTISGVANNSVIVQQQTFASDGTFAARLVEADTPVAGGASTYTYQELKGNYQVSGYTLTETDVQSRRANVDFGDQTTGWGNLTNDPNPIYNTMVACDFFLGGKLYGGYQPDTAFAGLQGAWSLSGRATYNDMKSTITLAADGTAQLACYYYSIGTPLPAKPSYSISAKWLADDATHATLSDFTGASADLTFFSTYVVRDATIKIARYGDWLVLGTAESADGMALIKQ
jgi:hypothetical protein